MGKTRNDEEYESGDHDGKNGGFLDDLIVGNLHSKDEIYRKGYEHGAEHRYDKEDSGNGGSGSSGGGGGGSSNGGSICYLTTACVEAMGFPDNCLELKTLRGFRDKILMQEPSSRRAVREYYRIAPEIVQSVEERDDAKDIWQGVYRNIRHAVSLILSGDFEGAFKHYQQMTMRLKGKYLD